MKKLKDMFFSGKDVMSFLCVVTWIARLMVLHMAILGRTLAAHRNVLGEVVAGVGYTDFPCSDGLLGTCIGRRVFLATGRSSYLFSRHLTFHSISTVIKKYQSLLLAPVYSLILPSHDEHLAGNRSEVPHPSLPARSCILNARLTVLAEPLQPSFLATCSFLL